MLPHPANVVMAGSMPRSAGIAASMITGFAWGSSSSARPLGVAAEAFGTVPALLGLSAAAPAGSAVRPSDPERERG